MFFFSLFFLIYYYTNVYFRSVWHVGTVMAATAEQARDTTRLEPLHHTNCHVTTATSSPTLWVAANANRYQDGEVLGAIINSRIFKLNEINRKLNKLHYIVNLCSSGAWCKIARNSWLLMYKLLIIIH